MLLDSNASLHDDWCVSVLQTAAIVHVIDALVDIYIRSPQTCVAVLHTVSTALEHSSRTNKMTRYPFKHIGRAVIEAVHGLCSESLAVKDDSASAAASSSSAAAGTSTTTTAAAAAVSGAAASATTAPALLPSSMFEPGRVSDNVFSRALSTCIAAAGEINVGAVASATVIAMTNTVKQMDACAAAAAKAAADVAVRGSDTLTSDHDDDTVLAAADCGGVQSMIQGGPHGALLSAADTAVTRVPGLAASTTAAAAAITSSVPFSVSSGDLVSDLERNWECVEDYSVRSRLTADISLLLSATDAVLPLLAAEREAAVQAVKDARITAGYTMSALTRSQAIISSAEAAAKKPELQAKALRSMAQKLAAANKKGVGGVASSSSRPPQKQPHPKPQLPRKQQQQPKQMQAKKQPQQQPPAAPQQPKNKNAALLLQQVQRQAHSMTSSSSLDASSSEIHWEESSLSSSTHLADGPSFPPLPPLPRHLQSQAFLQPQSHHFQQPPQQVQQALPPPPSQQQPMPYLPPSASSLRPGVGSGYPFPAPSPYFNFHPPQQQQQHLGGEFASSSFAAATTDHIPSVTYGHAPSNANRGGSRPYDGDHMSTRTNFNLHSSGGSGGGHEDEPMDTGTGPWG